jgi:hypothetical protein
MRILHLTLKKKWFDMIASGEKLEEYRDWKPYWAKRLTEGMTAACAIHAGSKKGFKHFDVVQFKNGYAKSAPTVTVQFMGIVKRVGRKKWGAEPGKEYFVIKLGEIIPPTQTDK